MTLLQHYIALFPSKTEAVKDLNKNLGLAMGQAYQWLDLSNKVRTPTKKGLSYMRRQVIKSVLDRRLKLDVDQEIAYLIAKDLS